VKSCVGSVKEVVEVLAILAVAVMLLAGIFILPKVERQIEEIPQQADELDERMSLTKDEIRNRSLTEEEKRTSLTEMEKRLSNLSIEQDASFSSLEKQLEESKNQTKEDLFATAAQIRREQEKAFEDKANELEQRLANMTSEQIQEAKAAITVQQELAVRNITSTLEVMDQQIQDLDSALHPSPFTFVKANWSSTYVPRQGLCTMDPLSGQVFLLYASPSDLDHKFVVQVLNKTSSKWKPLMEKTGYFYREALMVVYDFCGLRIHGALYDSNFTLIVGVDLGTGISMSFCSRDEDCSWFCIVPNQESGTVEIQTAPPSGPAKAVPFSQFPKRVQQKDPFLIVEDAGDGEVCRMDTRKHFWGKDTAGNYHAICRDHQSLLTFNGTGWAVSARLDWDNARILRLRIVGTSVYVMVLAPENGVFYLLLVKLVNDKWVSVFKSSAYCTTNPADTSVVASGGLSTDCNVVFHGETPIFILTCSGTTYIEKQGGPVYALQHLVYHSYANDDLDTAFFGIDDNGLLFLFLRDVDGILRVVYGKP